MSQSFTQAISPTEKDELLKSLSETTGTFLTLHTRMGKINFKIKKRAMDGLSVFPPSRISEDLSGTVVVDFVFNGTLYQSEGQLQKQERGEWHLALNQDLFKVQRRANFRTSLPKEWSNEVSLDQVEETRIDVTGAILDISLGGCFFYAEKGIALEVGKQVYGDMSISDYPVITFRGILRRCSPRDQGMCYGIEFIEIEGQGTQVLNNLTLKAARLTRDLTKK